MFSMKLLGVTFERDILSAKSIINIERMSLKYKCTLLLYDNIAFFSKGKTLARIVQFVVLSTKYCKVTALPSVRGN